MKGTNKPSKKKFLALLLSLLMVTSVTTAFASCGETEDDTSTDTETDTEIETEPTEPEEDEEVVVEDKDLITNMTFNDDKSDTTKPIITSVTGWSNELNKTNSGTARRSDAASGVIDVSDAKWKDLTTSGIDVDPKTLTEEQAQEKWESMTTKDKLEYYEAWKADTANKDRKITDLEFYEAFNIDTDDLPFVQNADDTITALENPGTPEGATDSRVLMIHNEMQNTYFLGTAQLYSSSSTVTVKAGETAKFSVWVKTSNLLGSSANNEDDYTAHNKGAYIRVEHSVGGKTLEPLEVKNINTDEWTQYSFVLCGSSFTDTTFSLKLGLGQSGGDNKEEYVNGYAFFDQITCEILDEDDTIDTSKYVDGNNLFTFETEKADKTIAANKNDTKDFMLDFSTVGSGFNTLFDVTGWEAEYTTDKNKSGETIYSTVPDATKGEVLVPALTESLYSESDIKGAYNLAELANGDATQKAVYNNYFKDDTFLGTADALLLLSKKGAAYKAEKTLNIPVGYSVMSFYVKTSEMKGYTGAGIELKFADETLASAQSIYQIDTTTLGDKNDEQNGWQRVFFFINNETNSIQEATLTLSFGPTSDFLSATSNTFHEGFAAFANFESKNIPNDKKAEFDCAVNNTYTKIVKVSTPEKEDQVDNGFDSTGNLDEKTIETGFAKAKNYTGIYNDSALVGGNSLTSNNLATAGLLNKQYASTYATTLNFAGGLNFGDWDNTVGAGVTQPLVIYNQGSNANKAYGFIGNSITISANAYKTISMKVKVSEGAVANIYLVDTSEDNYNDVLSIGRRVTYWYDKDGNVCAKDPTDKSFNAKEDVAFKLQKNGLYKVNTNWTGATGVDADAYFANLAAYSYDEDTKNLMLDDAASDYAYSDLWLHDGNDRVAFYNYDAETKSAFAYSDNTTKVYDFSLATALTPRYTAADAKDMHISVTDTNGEWVKVSFYVHAGFNAKNYRLEIWNGARDGGYMGAETYVMVDSWTPAELTETTWNTLISDAKKVLEDNNKDTYFEGAFSFYDSPQYLRYDETIDELDVGDVYTNYNATEATDKVMYLQTLNQYEIFADYSAAEAEVTKDPVEEDVEEEEETEEEDNSTNVWILASSIAIAAVLLLTIVSLIVRKVFAVRRKKNSANAKKTKK